MTAGASSETSQPLAETVRRTSKDVFQRYQGFRVLPRFFALSRQHFVEFSRTLALLVECHDGLDCFASTRESTLGDPAVYFIHELLWNPDLHLRGCHSL